MKRKKRMSEPETAGGAPESSAEATAAVPGRDAVATRAYQLYQERGGGDGAAMEDWLRAEQELARRTGRRDES